MNEEELLNRLRSLRSTQFSEVLFCLRVDEALVPTNAPQTQKAIELIQLLRQSPDGLMRLENEIRRILNISDSETSSPSSPVLPTDPRPIVSTDPPTPERHTENRPSTAAVLISIIAVLVGLTIQLAKTGAGGQTEINPPTRGANVDTDSDLVISRGDRPVIGGTLSTEKSSAMSAYRDREWDAAIHHFINSLQQQKNDPESWVYLNNAIAEWSASNQIGKQLNVAITVPTQPDSERLKAIRNENIPEELLRGVALRQTAFNCGIETLTEAVKQGSLNLNECKGKTGLDGNQKFVHVTVADDRDAETSTEDLAPIIASQPEILGVIGHFSSGNCRVANNIYKQKQLVSISPTCSSTELSRTSPYFFRTMLSDAVAAEKLYKYVADYPDLATVIAFDEHSEYSKSFKAAFGRLLPNQKYEDKCPFSNFSASNCADLAKTKGAKFFVLVPSTTEMLTTLLSILKPLRDSRIIPLGADSVYNPVTVSPDFGQLAVETGLLISVPWHPRQGKPTQFELDSKRMFGTASVNWRTQSTFDAMSALTTGLQQLKSINPTRQELRDI